MNSKMDFTLKKFEELLQVIKDNSISTYGIHDWIMRNPKEGILMRHDVDRKPKNSLKITKLEKRYDISSTYYFRSTQNSFVPEIIKEISSLGHEIGYHYEDLSIANGNQKEAIKLFRKHLKRFEGLVDVKTIAMHGRPLSRFDNRELWEKYNFKDFGITAEAFLSIDYSDIYYFTDTGRSWNPNAANLRDKADNQLSANISSTDELIEFVKNNKNQKIALISHPERWIDFSVQYLYSLISDNVQNIIKRIIKTIR